MLIAGVDLAAQPKGTALAVIDWGSESAELVTLVTNANDELIVRESKSAVKIGIDCALSWPTEFVDFLNRHSNPSSSNEVFDGGIETRRRLAYRETDRVVRQQTGRWPLSVSTDRLGMTALRCAGLLSRLHSSGTDVDRSGTGGIVEVYPGAALRYWGFETKGYRVSADVRAQLVAKLNSTVPWLSLGTHAELMVNSCDAFDSVFAALAARCAYLGGYEKPSAKQLALAKVEGWIALPNLPLTDLLNLPAGS
jgi:predicted nuclease with RNAse H fold